MSYQNPNPNASGPAGQEFPNRGTFGQSLGSQSKMGSLAQEARKKQLATARWIMIVIGVLQLGAGLVFVLNARQFVKAEFDKQVAQLQGQGMQVDQEELKKLEDSATSQTQLLNMGGVLGGISLIALGILVYRYPVVCTVTGLVLYIGLYALFGYLTYMETGDGSVFYRGGLFRILIIVAMFKAIQAALAYEKERKSTQSYAGSPFSR